MERAVRTEAWTGRRLVRLYLTGLSWSDTFREGQMEAKNFSIRLTVSRMAVRKRRPSYFVPSFAVSKRKTTTEDDDIPGVPQPLPMRLLRQRRDCDGARPKKLLPNTCTTSAS